MFATLALALLVPAAPTALTYAAPSRRAPVKIFKVSEWSVGERAFVATDLVNVRAAPQTGARVVTQLDFGTEVSVLARGPRVRVGKAVSRWYEVEAKASRGTVRGHLFGTTLSPFLVKADLDEDGVDEFFSVGWTAGFAARVRAFEPLAFGADRRAKRRFTPGGTWKGGRGTKLAVVSKQTAGLPLLELEVLIDDPGASYKTLWRTFFAYHPPEDGGRGAGRLVEQFSSYRNNDVDSEVLFDAKTKTATIRFVRAGKPASSGDTYKLSGPPPRDGYECTLAADGLTGGPPGKERHRDGRHFAL